MTPHEATAIHKSIRRNHVAFTGYGRPTSWDWPTLRATYLHLAEVLRAVIDAENETEDRNV